MTMNEAKEIFKSNLTIKFAYVDEQGNSDGIFQSGFDWLIDMNSMDEDSWGNPTFVEREDL